MCIYGLIYVYICRCIYMSLLNKKGLWIFDVNVHRSNYDAKSLRWKRRPLQPMHCGMGPSSCIHSGKSARDPYIYTPTYMHLYVYIYRERDIYIYIDIDI